LLKGDSKGKEKERGWCGWGSRVEGLRRGKKEVGVVAISVSHTVMLIVDSVFHMCSLQALRVDYGVEGKDFDVFVRKKERL
jgi:hypothetical protein